MSVKFFLSQNKKHSVFIYHSKIAVGCGAKQIIFNAFLASIEQGDEIIIPAPYWASYPDKVRACGGKPVVVNCSLMNEFRLQPEQLTVVTERSRWRIINAPGNPSGVMDSAEDLESLGAVQLKHHRLKPYHGPKTS